jgi:hypothetical protein
VVVAVGITLVEPLSDVDVNVPGVIATLVAPVADQLSVLLEPELMLVGLAAKDVIAGAEPFPGGELVEIPKPQPARPTQANRMRTSAQSSSCEKLDFRERSFFLQNESWERIHDPFATVVHTSLVILKSSIHRIRNSVEEWRWSVEGLRLTPCESSAINASTSELSIRQKLSRKI